MTQGSYYVGIDQNRDSYFPHGVAQGNALNLVDNPAQLKTSRISADANHPTFTRDFYNTEQNYHWEFVTGTAVDDGFYIGQTSDFEYGTWIPSGTEITVAMEFKGITNYTGETLRFTAAGRGGGGAAPNTASTTVALTGAWQQVSVTITPATEHLLLTIERITTLTNVTYQMRKHFVVIGASLPAAFNTGVASDYYEDISTYVQNMSWNNGMDHYDQTVSGGAHATVTLDNRDGLFYQNDDLAAEILLNTDFENWIDANNPTSWTGTNLSANAQTTEVGSDELHGGTGTDALNLYATTRVLVSCAQDGLTVFQRYRVRFSIGAASSAGGIRFFTGNAQFIYPVSRIYTLPGVYTFYFTAGSFSQFFITNNRYPCDITLEFVEVTPVPRYAGLGKETLLSIRGSFGSSEEQMFIGRVTSITPDGGQYAMRTVTMECVDAMEEFNTLEYRPTEVYEGTSPLSELILMFNHIGLTWPYAKDYWILGTSVLGIDTWLHDGAALTTYSGADEFSVDFATASASNSSKGIAAQAFTRDLMALEIGGRFYVNARTGVFTAVSHTYDPSISSSTAITDDDFDSFELPYADDVLNTISIWYKQKRLGEGNIVLWSNSQDIVVGAKSSKTITGRYFDPTNELINVSAVTTEPITRNVDFIITPSTQYDYRVTVTAEAGATSVTFTIENIRQVDVTISTLQIRGFPLYALTEESITVQNIDSLLENNIQKRDYNMPLISSNDTAIAIATGLTTMRGEAIERLQSITFSATKTDTRYSRAISQFLGLHYAITSSVLKHSAEYVIIGEKHSIKAGGDHTHMVTWVLAPVELFNYWILGQAGRSELGTTTIPIY